MILALGILGVVRVGLAMREIARAKHRET